MNLGQLLSIRHVSEDKGIVVTYFWIRSLYQLLVRGYRFRVGKGEMVPCSLDQELATLGSGCMVYLFHNVSIKKKISLKF